MNDHQIAFAAGLTVMAICTAALVVVAVISRCSAAWMVPSAIIWAYAIMDIIRRVWKDLR